MSIQMNIGDHLSPETGWVSVPANHRPKLSWARRRARVVAQRIPSANVFFKRLPGGRSLSSLLGDRTIWINFDPSEPAFGAQSGAHPHEIAMGPSSFRMGRWTVLATLIHELAHVNGAPGGSDRRAEEALLHCGLGRRSEKTTGIDDPRTPYDPDIEG